MIVVDGPGPSGVPELTAWRQLRQWRSEPPGLASPRGKRRREVFVTALEQSEQLLKAAAQTDYAVRPILAFYGLSQGARALAAAAVADDSWHMQGHGLQERDRGNPKTSLQDLCVEQQDSGAFVTISALLGSGLWQEKVAMGALWRALPAYRFSPLANDACPPVLELLHNPPRLTVRGIPAKDVDPGNRKSVLAYLDKNYPSLKGHREPEAERVRDVLALKESWGEAVVQITVEYEPARSSPKTSLEARSDQYMFVRPAIGGAGAPPHLLSIWWAVLFALSMRARYSPSVWVGDDLNIDKTPSATWLEQALDEAVTIVPELLLATLRQKTTGLVP